MNNELISEAISNLQLLTIKLHKSILDRQDDFIEGESPEYFAFQYMRNVGVATLEAEDDENNKIKILRVFPKFGVRAIQKQNNKKKPKDIKVLFKIEATFRADYQIKLPLSDAAIREFAKYNAIYNVWAFWRQHVFDMTARAGLPDVNIPLFSAQK